jgi:hypothetical protein
VRAMYGRLGKPAALFAAVVAVAVPVAGHSAGSGSAASPATHVTTPVTTAEKAAGTTRVTAAGTTLGTTTAAGTTLGTTTAAAAALPTAPSALVAVRAGRHVTYDRLVLEFRGRVPGHTVRYVRQVLTQGQGAPIPLAGRADLEIVVRSGSLYTPRDPAHLVDVRGFPALRQVAWGGSFEGYTTIGVGVRTRLPIHVFVLAGPGRDNRLVIDVAHHC